MPARSRVFISYRRADSAAQAGRLHDILVAQYGEDSVFMDVDSIPLGHNFVSGITDAVRQSVVVVVLIGQKWLSGGPNTGNRLRSPGDYVTKEIELAFQHDVRIVPLLINGTPAPTTRDMPRALEEFPNLQALELHDASFRRDAAPLLTLIAEARKGAADGIASNRFDTNSLMDRLRGTATVHLADSRGSDPGQGWNAYVTENVCSLLTSPRWSVSIKLSHESHLVSLRSPNMRHIIVDGSRVWRGRMRELTRARIALTDGAQTRYMTISGSATTDASAASEFIITVDGKELTRFAWGQMR